jgi:hypothetical protein
MKTCERSTQQIPLDLMSSAEDSPVKTSQWLGAAKGWLESEAGSGSTFTELLWAFGQLGWSSKTSPAYSPPERDMTSLPYWEDLPESYRAFLAEAGEALASSRVRQGTTTSPGACLTANTSELPSDAAVSSLSQVLEPQVASKYYLSPKACAGILRRAEKRGKKLPERLAAALEAVVRAGIPTE